MAALATQQTFQFEDDMRKLRVQRPAFEPASRDYVTDVVFLARVLLDRGVAYERDGSVYFRAGDLWKRSGLPQDEAVALLRPARRSHRRSRQGRPRRRRHLAALGRGRALLGLPVGPGPPGLARRVRRDGHHDLGLGVDVHGGGADLAYPHHAFERPSWKRPPA